MCWPVFALSSRMCSFLFSMNYSVAVVLSHKIQYTHWILCANCLLIHFDFLFVFRSLKNIANCTYTKKHHTAQVNLVVLFRWTDFCVFGVFIFFYSLVAMRIKLFFLRSMKFNDAVIKICNPLLFSIHIYACSSSYPFVHFRILVV